MSFFTDSERLAAQGRFSDALRKLQSVTFSHQHAVDTSLLEADLEQRVGSMTRAETQVSRLLKSASLTPTQRSTCLFILGRVASDRGEAESAAAFFQRSIQQALVARDFTKAAWAQAKLLTIVCDSLGPEAIGPLLSDLRLNALRSGDVHVLAAMHVFVGEVEAQRSAVVIARRHARMALSLLVGSPNVWLESIAEHLIAALDIMCSDFSSALAHGERAVDLAELSGQILQRAATYANLGYTLYLAGEFELAIRHCERALALFAPGGDQHSGVLDTLAKIQLERGDLGECERFLDKIERAIRSDLDRARYVYRHSLLTRVQLLIERKNVLEGLKMVETAIRMGMKSRDHAHIHSALVLRADLELRANNTSDVVTLIDRLGQEEWTRSPEMIAGYERALACALGWHGNTAVARVHYERAKRIYDALGHKQGTLELLRAWDASASGGTNSIATSVTASPRNVNLHTSSNVVQALASLAGTFDRSEVLAHEFAVLIEQLHCVEELVIESNDSRGNRKTLIQGSSDVEQMEHFGSFAVDGEHQVIVHVRRKHDIESVATLNALLTISRLFEELTHRRIQEQAHSALWPPDKSLMSGTSVSSGHMAELMTFAQRVAPTNILVLIVGESGTGKEILARAVHDFSDRAKKPFVPLNCAAVPPHLLESTLFGHRRGAFTGADQDNPGVIRSARDGTLFLDEIGELSLDLQPKLLRFLESGEISPLGEPTSTTVNVRIVAATNRNLSDLVQAGRFREDLFYRLNVVRLTVKPLRERRDEIPNLVNHFVARAAKEFAKGYIQVAEETMERLLLYRWPGNVRQLQNEIRRMVALVEPGATLQPEMISDEILAALPLLRPPRRRSEIAVPLHDKLTPTISRIESEMIRAALREHHGKVDDAARALGISRKGLYLKRQRLGL
jgi:transcriptional regulator with PAS, ATPase and Fis domain/tetratricopeptide (TPR) repeat protein